MLMIGECRNFDGRVFFVLHASERGYYFGGWTRRLELRIIL